MARPLPPVETVNQAPSWQARLFNRILALGFKRPLQGMNRVDQVRQVAAAMDRLAVLPRSTDCRGYLIDGLSCYWYRVPESEDSPVILYLHGGGFIIKTPRSHGAMLARLCAHAGATGVMVDYHLAPEHPVSRAYADCLQAYRRVLESGIAPGQVIIAGDSAGGNLALATLMRIRDLGLPPPAGAILFSPCTDLTLSGDSVLANLDADPMLCASFLAVVRQSVQIEPGMELDPRYSPYHGSLAGLPPVLVVAGTEELLLDDARAVAAKLKASGNRGDLRLWQGLPHVFQLLHRIPEADRCLAECGAFIRQSLAQAKAGRPVSRTTAE
ncbi:alpha/beta hydrolase [Ferrimonas sediminicola]|uniref:Alpha/beta hydrolase n=1 Tax=Ferrimonas sediminicola TaxID=2569538 RepID=A0A4U1BBF4_9GAMM|nr:alpha/beta hydrolase [Ferrimonas sediminicola]TKB47349.1 alpha/beta hydrolase [Ferrimonas sediminicola]